MAEIGGCTTNNSRDVTLVPVGPDLLQLREIELFLDTIEYFGYVHGLTDPERPRHAAWRNVKRGEREQFDETQHPDDSYR